MNISDAARELLPCPFCGGEAEVVDVDPHGTTPVEARAVVCQKCQASSPNMHCSNTAGAIRNASQAWNTRDNTATAALTLELEKTEIARAELWREKRECLTERDTLSAVCGDLRDELETVKRERDGLRQIDVPMWVFELAGGESIPAHQILPDKARLTQAEFLPWVSNLLRTLAGERDTLRQQLAEAREDARRLDALDNMANVKIAESNRPDRWMIERDTEAVPNPVRANSIRAAIDATLNPPTDEK